MEIEITRVLFGTENGEVMSDLALLHEGQLWLPLAWLATPDEQWMTPTRAVRLPMALIRPSAADPAVPWVLDGSIPRRALAGESAGASGFQFEVVERPLPLLPGSMFREH